MKRVVVSDEMLDKFFEEWANGYTTSGVPFQKVYSFGQYVEMKKTTLAEVA